MCAVYIRKNNHASGREGDVIKVTLSLALKKRLIQNVLLWAHPPRQCTEITTHISFLETLYIPKAPTVDIVHSFRRKDLFQHFR